MLPEIKRVKMPKNVFPTLWQAVLFRNYGLIKPQNLAAVLSCSEEILHTEAERLGLLRTEYNPDWAQKGYITLIRNNWFLLPYKQLIKLLGIDEARLDFILQNDDFLSVKLGDFKPECAEVSYAPLTEEESAKTQLVADMVRPFLQNRGEQPFKFFRNPCADKTIKRADGTRIVHGYLSPCGDAFDTDTETHLPDGLLAEYAKQGVNGVWLHGVLSTLSPYPFDEAQSNGFEARRKEMKKLVARLKSYGIKLYLYMNEPRGLAENKFGKYSHLIGRRERGYASLCFEQKETREYLYNAVKDLLCAVPDLGGIITITMSENLTHCHYLPNTNCPVCKNIPPERTAASVNNTIQKAIKDSGSGAELIANLWGWSPYMEWTEEQTLRGVEMLDKDISVMCVSEYDLPIVKGGVESKIIDYSISNPGPSQITKNALKKAVETGHKPYAKIQINNSWECSAAPYLPVFDLTFEHLQNLAKIGVKDYMLTWTLGGYPSPAAKLVADFTASKGNMDLSAWYKGVFGENADGVHNAVKTICDAFREYPFSVQSLYLSPKTLGAANLWTLEAEEKRSVMVSYCYDDFESWIYPYPYEIYLSQYEKLLKGWGQGCDELQKLPSTPMIDEMKIFAKAAYLHFETDYLQTRFSFEKRDKEKHLQSLIQTAARAKDNAEALLALVRKCPLIGFETSNHYFYNERNLIEKSVNMSQILDELKKN
ncbi:MAG: hypothetical protein IJ308_04900 [Clostridia bacterium]|nr:hypothetical protein [Clostridia bacterium]